MEQNIATNLILIGKNAGYLLGTTYDERKEFEENNQHIIPDNVLSLESLFLEKIENFGLKTRFLNGLKDGPKIKNFGDLLYYKPYDFLKFRNIGKKSLPVLMELIKNKGFEFQPPENYWLLQNLDPKGYWIFKGVNEK